MRVAEQKAFWPDRLCIQHLEAQWAVMWQKFSCWFRRLSKRWGQEKEQGSGVKNVKSSNAIIRAVESWWVLNSWTCKLRGTRHLTLIGHLHLSILKKRLHPNESLAGSQREEGFLILQVRKLEIHGGDKAFRGHKGSESRSWTISKVHHKGWGMWYRHKDNIIQIEQS